MHVIYLFTFDYSLCDWKESGILSRELKPYLELAKKGVRTTFITYGDEKDYKIIYGIKNIDILPIYSIMKKSKFKYLNYIKSLYIPIIVKKYISYFDIIKQNQLMGSWVGIILKVLTRKPFYMRTGYDMYTFAKLEKKSRLKIIFLYLLTKYSLYFSDLYSISSISDFKFLSNNFDKHKEKLIVRKNWVPNVRTKKFEDRYNNRILMVGRLVNQKNYFEALDLLDGLNLSIDIVGTGELKSEIEVYAKNKLVKVNFLGNIDNEKLINLYPKYRIYFSSSNYEGNSKSLLEAMSAGCVSIVKNIKNNLELLDDENLILYDSNISNENFKKIILKSINDKNYFLKYSVNAENYVNKFNSIGVLTENLMKDYELLI